MDLTLKGFKRKQKKDNFKKKKEFVFNNIFNYFKNVKKSYYIIICIIIAHFLLSVIPYSIILHNQEDKGMIIYITMIVVFIISILGLLIHIDIEMDYSCYNKKDKINFFFKRLSSIFLGFCFSMTILYFIGSYTYYIFFPKENIKENIESETKGEETHVKIGNKVIIIK